MTQYRVATKDSIFVVVVIVSLKKPETTQHRARSCTTDEQECQTDGKWFLQTACCYLWWVLLIKSGAILGQTLSGRVWKPSFCILPLDFFETSKLEEASLC